MSEFVRIDFSALDHDMPAAAVQGGEAERQAGCASLVVFVGEDLKPSAAAARALGASANLIERAAPVSGFKGKSRTALDILAPAGLGFDRLVVVGVGKDVEQSDFVVLGGYVMGRIRDGGTATILFDFAGHAAGARAASAFSLGMRLRAYKFDRYKTKKEEADKAPPPGVTIAVADVSAVRVLAQDADAVASGVHLARTLVNEPPNVLFPIEFARRAAELTALGVEVEVLDAAAAEKLGMRALLAVGQGSAHESRVVIMRWAGAEGQPVAFVGKGVCFDTGGISIKPSAGMEDMKGDMAGAAVWSGSCMLWRPARPRSMPSGRSASSRTCPTAMRSARAIS